MNISRLSCVAVTGALLSLPATLHAHGGQYRGPGDTVPPGTRGHGGKTGGPGGPKTPGPGGPSAPTPSGGSPGTKAPGSPGFGGKGGTTTGGGGMTLTDDLSSWNYWWEFNKDPFLNLKAKIHSARAMTGSDDYIMGRGRKHEGNDTLKPSRKDLEGRVIPALKEALTEPGAEKDIVSSCMIALAKIGGDPELLQLFRRFLPAKNQEKQESAAIAMAITGLPEAVPDLLALAKDSKAGRKLVADSGGVGFRTRSFACYGLGLIAHRVKDVHLKTRVFEAMREIAGSKKYTRRDLRVAALNAIRLLRPGDTQEDKRLRTNAVDFLLGFMDTKERYAQIRAHAITAIASLCGRNGDPKGMLKRRIVQVLKTKQRGAWLYQSAILALGQMATPDDTAVSKALQHYMLKGKDQQAKYFCGIALGQIGGADNRTFLRKRLVQRQTQSIHKPWLALGLAVMDHEVRKTDRSREVDSTAEDIERVFAETKSPLFAAGLAIALGIMRHDDAGDRLLERMLKRKNDEKIAGYLAVALGLMGFQEATLEIQGLVENATRRPELLTQCSIALGLLGDKEVGARLATRMKENNTVAVYSALAQALGFIGDRKSLTPLLDLLEDESQQPLSRAFAAVALGLVGDKESLPWNSKIAVNINYRANVETLTGNGTGILDIL